MVTLERQLMAPILQQGLSQDDDDLEEGEIPEYESDETPVEKVAQQPVVIETTGVKPERGNQTELANSALRTVESYVNKVTLAAACESLQDACEHLYQALSALNGLSSADELVAALALKIVDKIRIVHHIYNATKTPLSVYQSLTKLANLYTEKVFTPEQLKELNSRIQTVKDKRQHDYVPWDGVIEEETAPPSVSMSSYGRYLPVVDDVPSSPTPSDEDERNRYKPTVVIPGVTNRADGPSAGLVRKREAPETDDANVKRLKLDEPRPPPSGGWIDPDDDSQDTALMQNISKPQPQQRSGGFLDEETEEEHEEALPPELVEVLSQFSEAERAAILKERERRRNEQEQMLKARKLCLVLDLDHTLLNSAKFSEVEPNWDTYLRACEVIERNKEGNPNAPRREIYRSTYMSMWTKLRPGIWKFLARASELYVLHLYTMGNKAYATEMAKLLDPTGVLFAGRVIAKGDDGVAAYGDEKVPRSKDLDGVLGMETGVLIIDDSTRVWPHHRTNLIAVERYMYFPCSRRQFGIPGPSLLEAKQDEREADGILSSILAVIERVHREFYQQPNPRSADARVVLDNVRKTVLAGCKVVFSRIFPVEETQPELHPLWCLAEQYGATCTLRLEEDVTHVVAYSLGTEKCNWAIANGRHVVRPGWVEASAVLYRRANEREFAL